MDEMGALFPAELLEQVRERFYYVDHDPITGDRTWLESASGSLRLKAAVRALTDQTCFPDQLGRANPSSRAAGELMAKGMDDVKLFLGAKSGGIVPAMSSTHAVFRIVNAALAAADGTNVVTTDLEHPCVFDSTWRFAQQYGQEWRVAHVNPENGEVAPESVLEQVDKDTAMIGLIHGSNITGAVLDVGRVVREARQINPHVIVLADGVQYSPHAPVDVEELGMDAYVFGPYKAFCAKGIGFGYVSERLVDLEHWRIRGSASSSWLFGSPEDPTYAAWSAVVDYLCWLGSHFTESEDRRQRLVAGMCASEKHLLALLERALHGTDRLPGLLEMEHVSVHAVGDDLSGRLCLVLFNVIGLDSTQAVAAFNSKKIRLHNRVRDAYSKHTLDALGLKEGVRLSACHYNSPRDIDRFLQAAGELASVSAAEMEAISGGGGVSGPGEG